MELTDLKLVQEGIDKIIGAVGSKQFLHLLQIFTPSKSISGKHKERIHVFIIHCVSIYFKIPYDSILGSDIIGNRKTSKYNDERQVCYYLIKKHLKLSVQEIADIFERDKKNVHDGIKKMEYHMGDSPKLPDKELIEDIKIIDNQVTEFKAIILSNGEGAKK